MQLVFRDYGHQGLTRLDFLKALQEFHTVMQSTVMSTDFHLGSPSVRKLNVKECVEVLEGPRDEVEGNLKRARCRAVTDGKVGWVSLRNQEGTELLKPSIKLMARVVKECPLLVSPDGPALRELPKGEILEVLEGPRKEVSEPEVFIKGSASKDGAVGWISPKDAAGPQQSSRKFWTCRSSIAMTDNLDLKACKVLRKISVGETLEAVEVEGSPVDSGGIPRIRVQASKDGKEGWVTIRGNQGTIYLEVSSVHHVLTRDTVLRSAPGFDTPAVRSLAAGEIFAADGGRHEAKPEPAQRLYLRGEEGQAGWVLWRGPPPVRPMSQEQGVQAE